MEHQDLSFVEMTNYKLAVKEAKNLCASVVKQSFFLYRDYFTQG
jgi:hypothetical protein